MPTPTNFEGINPRGTQTLIPCKDAKAQNGVIANTKLIKDTVGWSGKNKNPYPNGTRQVIDGSGNISDNANFYLSPYIDVTAIQNWVFTASAIPSGAGVRIATYDSSKTFVDRSFADFVSVTGGYKADWTVPSNINYIRLCYEDSSSSKVADVMIRDADILDDTYEPYFGSTAFPRSEQAVLGAKNINRTKYVSQTSSSVVWTANDDGSITAVSGTATGDNGEIGSGINNAFVAPFTAQVKIIGGLSSNIFLYPYDYTDSARPYKDATKTGRLTVSDNQWGDTPLEFYMIKGHKYIIAGRVLINVTANNNTMYPRLLLASDTDTSFSAPAMTNEQLTNAVKTTTQVITKNGLDISCTRRDNFVIISIYNGAATEAYSSGDTIVALDDFDELFTANDAYLLSSEGLNTYDGTSRLWMQTNSKNLVIRAAVSAGGVIRTTMIGVVK